MTVSALHPKSMLKVKVPRAGRYSYSLAANAIFNVEEQPKEYSGVGQGQINVEQGKRFSLQGAISGETWIASVVEQ